MKKILITLLFSCFFLSNLNAQGLTLELLIGGFDDNGVAYILLFEKGQKFVADSEVCKKVKVNIVNKKCIYKFSDLKKGSYAVMVFHDQNNNKKLDTNFIGMPKEGVGNSNNQTGIPSYSKCEINLAEDKQIKILMFYI